MNESAQSNSPSPTVAHWAAVFASDDFGYTREEIENFLNLSPSPHTEQIGMQEVLQRIDKIALGVRQPVLPSSGRTCSGRTCPCCDGGHLIFEPSFFEKAMTRVKRVIFSHIHTNGSL